ncbi:hypothetical protein D3C72_1475380 [compost metagenome]
MPPSTASNPACSTKVIAVCTAIGSSPATAMARRPGVPAGWPSAASVCASTLLKALTTGRPSWADTQMLSAMPASICAIAASRMPG